jgi:hypothetical protein
MRDVRELLQLLRSSLRRIQALYVRRSVSQAIPDVIIDSWRSLHQVTRPGSGSRERDY